MKNTNTTPLKKRFYVLLALAVVAVLGSALTVRHMTRRLTRGLAEFATGSRSRMQFFQRTLEQLQKVCYD